MTTLTPLIFNHHNRYHPDGCGCGHKFSTGEQLYVKSYQPGVSIPLCQTCAEKKGYIEPKNIKIPTPGIA